MSLRFPIHKAARILRHGGVIAYPTEGVFGLGCLPDDPVAVDRILQIKQRDASQGLIIIAANRGQLEPWVDSDASLVSDGTVPITWLAPPTVNVPDWITGEHERVAVRIVAHPVAAAICTQLGSAIVSTSANRSGQAPARTAYVLRRKLGDLVDYVVPGRCGPFRGPSEIRDLLTGSTIRQSGK